MASSRWKRFAFFDRNNLSLPPVVVKDIIPSKSSGSSRGSTTSDNLDPKFLYQNELTTTNNTNIETVESLEDVTKIGSGEYFSLVAANNVSLPVSLSSGGEGTNDIDTGEDGASQQHIMGVATKRGVGGDGAAAMNTSLIVLRQQQQKQQQQNGNSSTDRSISRNSSSSNNVMTIKSNNNTNNNNCGGDGELLLLFASSRNTSLVHCIDITLRCTPSNPHLLVSSSQQQQDTSDTANQIMHNEGGVSSNNNAFASSSTTTNSPQRNNTNNASTDSNVVEDLDGWRGHYNPFTTCNGFITAKTKDVNLLGSSTVGGLSPKLPSKSASGTASHSKKKSAAEQRILDEHISGDTAVDNTGGSLFGASPFANDYQVDGPQQSKQQSMPTQTARIVGLATCSLSSSSSSSSTTRTCQSSNKSSSSTLYVAAITDTPNTIGVVVHANPHLMLSSRPPLSSSSSTVEGGGNNTKTPYSSFYKPSSLGPFNLIAHGKPRCVTILPGVVCIGTDSGVVLIYVFKCNTVDNSGGKLSLVAEIPAPRSISSNSDADGEGKKMYSVSSVELIRPSLSEINNTSSNGSESNIHRLFVSYRRRAGTTKDSSPAKPCSGNNTNSSSTSGPSGGVCCYDLGGLRIPGQPVPSSSTGMTNNAPVVSARYDMDGRDVGTSCLCDGASLPQVPPSFQSGDNREDSTPSGSGMEKMLPRYVVARSDGLHLYSPEEKVGVTPIDGNKLAICSLPPPPVVYLRRPVRRQGTSNPEGNTTEQSNSDGTINGVGASYALVATTDTKSNRDAVDIYDTSNKLVGYHVLLSPGHRALRTVGIFSSPTVGSRSLVRGGRSSAVVLTSGGSIVTLTEKVTPDKVELLTQKNLYGAAISLTFSDPQFYCPEDIVALYRRYAEHLYRKGDFSAAMDQYILTIGSLESSHVIFRFLDAPKIHLAVKYLIALRAAGLASSVYDELLRTCYLKLGDVDAASKIILSSKDDASVLSPDGLEVPTVPISRNLLASSDNPSEMLAAICSLSAEEAVKALVAHGVFIARSLPRETAGVVIALCDGSYSPTDMADAAAGRDGNERKCDKYPISLFQNAFMENPKLFRLILSHCRRNDCVLTPMLRRTLLELTLDEWGSAKRTGDMHAQKLRHNEAIILLSENSHVDDMGDYEALVIVQASGFTEGEIILYERLNMVDMLMEEYAKSGTDRSRRQMLAMCENDPEVLADVLSHFVKMAGDRLTGTLNDDATIDSESEIGGLLYDIHEALVMARDHGELPPVRILRILAGEKNGMFSCDNISNAKSSCSSVPLSAAIDYVGTIMDESSKKIHRLTNNVEEYNRLCNDMEDEINSLLSPGSTEKKDKRGALPNIDDINEMYYNLLQLEEESKSGLSNVKRVTDTMKEDFWRDLEQSDSDPFDTISFYMAKGYLDNV